MHSSLSVGCQGGSGAAHDVELCIMIGTMHFPEGGVGSDVGVESSGHGESKEPVPLQRFKLFRVDLFQTRLVARL